MVPALPSTPVKVVPFAPSADNIPPVLHARQGQGAPTLHFTPAEGMAGWDKGARAHGSEDTQTPPRPGTR